MEEPQPKKFRKLTKKEKTFVENYVETENGKDAALKSYNTQNPESARAIATENLSKLPIQHAIEEKRKTMKQALIDNGITEDYLAKKVDILLSAKDKEGTDDFNAIDKGVRHALNIHGVVNIDDQPKTQNIYNFIFSPQGQEKIKVVEAEIKDMLLKNDIKPN